MPPKKCRWTENSLRSFSMFYSGFSQLLDSWDLQFWEEGCGVAPWLHKAWECMKCPFARLKTKTYHLLPTPSLQVRLKSWCHQHPSMSWETMCLDWGTDWEKYFCWACLRWCGCQSSLIFLCHMQMHTNTFPRLCYQEQLPACSEHTHCQGFTLPGHLIVSFSSNICLPASWDSGSYVCVHTWAFCYCKMEGLWPHPSLLSSWQNQKEKRAPTSKFSKI